MVNTMAKKKTIKKIKKKATIYKQSQSFLKKHEADLRLLLVPVILFIILQIITIFVRSVEQQKGRIVIATQSALVPVASYTFFTRRITPPITAEAALILDRDSKNVLYEKNADVRFSMASTTKVMTALVALDYFKPDDILTAFTSNVQGVNAGVEVGDRLYFKDALYAMLLPSGNDIALMIAQNYPGGFEAFIKKMNQKAKALHLTNTHFADPAGLNDDGNYTTARELTQLASEASSNKFLADVVATRSKVISTMDGTKTLVLTNLNELLGQHGVTGFKTGHTEGAGDVLVTSAVMHGHTYILVVMRSQNRFSDTQILLASLTTDVTTFIPKLSN